MKVKLFTSDTMNDAMAQVKKELGRDAVILHTKRLRKGGVLGFFGKEMVEVLAAVDSTPIVSVPIVPNDPVPPTAPFSPPTPPFSPPEPPSSPQPHSPPVPHSPSQPHSPSAPHSAPHSLPPSQQQPSPPSLQPSQQPLSPPATPISPVHKKTSVQLPTEASEAAKWPSKPQPPDDVFYPVLKDVPDEPGLPDDTDAAKDATVAPETQQLESMQSEISSIKKMMEQFMDVISNPDKIDTFQNASPLFKLLIKNEVDPAVVAELVRGIPREQASKGLESETARQVVTERIAQYLKNIEGITLNPHSCKKVALIGPTGVGKTTTIAKLAANFTIKQGYKVALITADTYRIAAIEQLRIYADIIGIPLEIVYSPEELKNAFNRHTDKHLILIDNAGRSPSNSEQLLELKTLLQVDANIETHLVLSATIRYKEALEAANKFSVCSPNKILFTKIDESCTLGTLLNILYHFPSTLSYVTTGQSVPEDIELADANKLASLMLKDF